MQINKLKCAQFGQALSHVINCKCMKFEVSIVMQSVTTDDIGSCTYLESEPRRKGSWVGASICNPLILVGHVVEFPGKDTKLGQVSQAVIKQN